MTCFLLVGILLMIYIGYAVRKIKKMALKLGENIQINAENAFNDFENIKVEILTGLKHYDEIQGKANTILDAGMQYMSIPPSAHLLDAAINFFAHIGATELGKGGLNLDKEQIGRITMARNGFNVAGQRLAEGAGIPGIMERFGGMGGMVGMGSPGGEAGGLGGLGQMVLQMIFGGVGGGSQPAVKPGNDNEVYK